MWALAQRVWMHPRDVIRDVVAYDAFFGQREIILLLSAVSGLLAYPMGIDMMLLEAVLNFLALIAGTYSMAWLIWITGKPMGGKATLAELCAAMIWPMVPAIWGTLLALPLLAVETWCSILQGLFYLYSFHLMVETIAEVQGFGRWNSFLNQLFALILSLLSLLFFWNQIMGALRTLITF
jgi:hypothetical protein